MKNQSHYIAMQAGYCPLSTAQPGFAKTSSMLSFARAAGRKPYVLIGSIREPSDFGIPFPADDVRTLRFSDDEQRVSYFHLAAPKWAADCCDGGKWMVVLDELLCCPPAVQAGMLRLVAERFVGDLEMPADTWLCALTNPVSTATNGFALEPAMANRMVHLPWQMDWDSWDDGIFKGEFGAPEFPLLPDDWRQASRARIAANVVAFRHHMPDHFHPQLDAQGDVVGSRNALSGPWPSPRSWTMAVDVMAAAESVYAPREVRDELLRGCVGPVADAYLEWEDKLDLPDPVELINKAASAIALDKDFEYEHPSRVDQVIAMLYSVVAEICGNPEDTTRYNQIRWEAGAMILHKAGEHGIKDLVASCFRKMVRTEEGKSLIPKGTRIPKEIVRDYLPFLEKAM